MVLTKNMYPLFSYKLYAQSKSSEIKLIEYIYLTFNLKCINTKSLIFYFFYFYFLKKYVLKLLDIKFKRKFTFNNQRKK